jgi:hypothetical protein
MLGTQKVMNVLRGPEPVAQMCAPPLASGTAGDKTITSSPTKEMHPYLTRINARVHFHFRAHIRSALVGRSVTRACPFLEGVRLIVTSRPALARLCSWYWFRS